MRVRSSVALALTLLAAGLVGGQVGDAGKEKKDQAIEEDRKALLGKWALTSGEMAGKPFPLEKGPATLEFKRDTFDGFVPGMIYKIDPTKKPKHIDLIVTRDGKEIITRGIYSLEKGELTLAIPLVPVGKGTDNQRPENFDVNKDRPTMVLKAKRM
jgi:uncharacterized protein (TIGR03067 family)